MLSTKYESTSEKSAVGKYAEPADMGQVFIAD